ncbi:BA75_00077T0 [Komagataella pastoris]|uniref:BA75_00077T0 n=1 Tax=Komagataella pastoris TaxID=4922 RepID=A0A1B2J8G8_PICPA|nr:BA75_00077T0 [Komagataella pastoris]
MLSVTPESKSGKKIVAKRACLACREKKIKCDGEPMRAGKEADIIYPCTNCALCHTKCIFIPSNRGGRRKKGVSKVTNSDYKKAVRGLPQDGSVHNCDADGEPYPYNYSLNSPESLKMQRLYPDPLGQNHDARRGSYDRISSHSQLSPNASQHPQDYPTIGHQGQYPTFNLPLPQSGRPGNVYPSAPMRVSSSTGALPLKSVPLKYGTQQYVGYHPPFVGPHPSRDDPIDSTDSVTTMSYRDHTPHFQRTPSSLSSSRYYDQTSSWLRTQSHYGSNSPIDDSFLKPRKSLSSHSVAVKPRNSTLVMTSDSELELYEFPSWEITSYFIDLYYKYIHPARSLMPSKAEFLKSISFPMHASLLHSLILTCCTHADPKIVRSHTFRNPRHWYNLTEKYWPEMDLKCSLMSLTMLSETLSGYKFFRESIDGFQRASNLVKLNNMLASYTSMPDSQWRELVQISSTRQLMDRESFVRSIWLLYRLAIFHRLNEGDPFKPRPELTMEYPNDLEFPMSDESFFNSFSNKDSDSEIKKPVTWEDVSSAIDYSITTDKDEVTLPSSFENYAPAVSFFSTKVLSDVMDLIYRGICTLESKVTLFNSKLNALEKLSRNVYRIESVVVDKDVHSKVMLINCTTLTGLFQIHLSRSILHTPICGELLLFKRCLHKAMLESQKQNLVSEEILNSFLEALLSADENQWRSLVPVIMSASGLVKLLELGQGVMDHKGSNLQGQILPVVVGPTSLEPAIDIGVVDSDDEPVLKSKPWWHYAVSGIGAKRSGSVSTEPDVANAWVQYPLFASIPLCYATYHSASLLVLSKFVDIQLSTEDTANLNLKNNQVAIDFCIYGKRKVSLLSDDEKHDDKSGEILTRKMTVPVLQTHADIILKCWNSDILLEHMRLFAKFLQVQGKYYPIYNNAYQNCQALTNFLEDKFLPNL